MVSTIRRRVTKLVAFEASIEVDVWPYLNLIVIDT